MRSAFTLIELLIVIAIIAILSVVVILVLNPIQLLQQSRDSNRVSDMATLNTALGVYAAQGGTNLGSSSIVYVSVPDPTATSSLGDQCQGLGLPTLPATYSYQCAATSTYRQTNGTGWIPINFSSLPAGSPLGQLPVDPINTTSSREYYTYDTNGSQYEVTSVMESQKYQIGGTGDVISNDGGSLVSIYEKGTAYGLEPLDYGDNTLVGYWPLNEGTGTVAYDYSGNNSTGTWAGTKSGTNGTYYSTGKGKGFAYAGDFNGSNNNVVIPNTSTLANYPNGVTVSLWSYAVSGSTFSYWQAGPPYIDLYDTGSGSGMRLQFTYGSTLATLYDNITINPAWTFYAVTYNNSVVNLYTNGIVTASTSGIGTTPQNTSSIYIGGAFGFWNGLINDVRVYNRALSAAQIAAMYAAGK